VQKLVEQHLINWVQTQTSAFERNRFFQFQFSVEALTPKA